MDMCMEWAPVGRMGMGISLRIVMASVGAMAWAFRAVLCRARHSLVWQVSVGSLSRRVTRTHVSRFGAGCRLVSARGAEMLSCFVVGSPPSQSSSSHSSLSGHLHHRMRVTAFIFALVLPSGFSSHRGSQ